MCRKDTNVDELTIIELSLDNKEGDAADVKLKKSKTCGKFNSAAHHGNSQQFNAIQKREEGVEMENRRVTEEAFGLPEAPSGDSARNQVFSPPTSQLIHPDLPIAGDHGDVPDEEAIEGAVNEAG